MAIHWFQEAANAGFDLSMAVLHKLQEVAIGGEEEEEEEEDDMSELRENETSRPPQYSRAVSKARMRMAECHNVKLFSSTTKSSSSERSHEANIIYLLNCKVRKKQKNQLVSIGVY